MREAEGGNAERKQRKYKVPGDEEAREGKILLSERKKRRQKDGLFSLLVYLTGGIAQHNNRFRVSYIANLYVLSLGRNTV